MKNAALAELRSALASFMMSMSEGGTPTTIIQAFREQHSRSIATASSVLENIALTKLINDIGNSSGKENVGQMEIFPEYTFPSMITLPLAVGSKQKIHKAVSKSSKKEIEFYIKNYKDPRGELPKKVIELQRLLDEKGEFFTDDETTVAQAFDNLRLETRFKSA